MPPHSSTGSEIRRFIIRAIREHPRDIASLAAQRFGVSRQAINRHLRRLTADGVVAASGNTRARTYELVATTTEISVDLREAIEEDVVWRESVAPLLHGIPRNCLDICHHGFTEILNNAIDHSDGTFCRILVVRSAAVVEFWISDDGVGIFKKIRRALRLARETDAVLELTKGKFTTDPARHTGEGIFFTSRMFDHFGLLAGGLYFGHSSGAPSDWVLEQSERVPGTGVTMTIDPDTSRTAGGVFDQFAKPDEYAFSITHVPVALVRHGEENLVSRSQAKRLVNRFDRFEEVMLDFADVGGIGQAFADEIFRVFQLEHPHVRLVPINASADVLRMIGRARGALRASLPPNGEISADG